jgi:hypothetical protein
VGEFKDARLAILYLLSGVAFLAIAIGFLWKMIDRRNLIALDASSERRHREALALREKELAKDVEYAKISSELREKELIERQRENDLHEKSLQIKERGFE